MGRFFILGRLKPCTFRRFSVWRFGNRINGRRLWSRVWLQHRRLQKVAVAALQVKRIKLFTGSYFCCSYRDTFTPSSCSPGSSYLPSPISFNVESPSPGGTRPFSTCDSASPPCTAADLHEFLQVRWFLGSHFIFLRDWKDWIRKCLYYICLIYF